MVAVGSMLVVVASIILGISRPTPILALEGMVPVLVAPAYPILAMSLWRRRWVFATSSALLVVAHLVLCLPAATVDATPSWVAQAPTFSIYSANVRFDNDRYDAIAISVMRSNADVVVLNEVRPAHRAALERAGAMRRYTTEVHSDSPYSFGDLIMTRLPATEPQLVGAGVMQIPEVTIAVGSAHVRVMAVHPRSPPTARLEAKGWFADYASLRVAATYAASQGPLVMAGDFNATLWHEPFRHLLDAGFTDAHDALGEGLTGSWAPLEFHGVGGSLLRLDHCLYSPGIAARSIRNGEIPGSDHRPFLATLAVRPSASS